MNATDCRVVYPAGLNSLQGLHHDTFRQMCRLAAITAAMAAQDDYTQGHARRVAAYSERLAQRLDLTAREVETVRLGGLLHDIGKIAFSPQLRCNTRTQLSTSMQAEIRRHPETGGELLERIGAAWPVVACVRHHHERIDGSGYPRGLGRDRIPLGAKIVSIADCYDALTTDRSYQAGMDPRDALVVLSGMAGKTLCPDLIRVFCEMVREHPGGGGMDWDAPEKRGESGHRLP